MTAGFVHIPDVNKHVVGIGQASLDILGIIPKFPDQDEKCELSDLSIQGGGPVATALVALRRLGVSTSIFGVVGDDEFGCMIKSGLEEEGVDVSHLVIRKNSTSQTAFIAVGPDASRTIFWHRGDNTDINPEDLDVDYILSADALHVDGLKTAASIFAAGEMKKTGKPVFFDAGTMRDGYLELAALTDYLICSERFFAEFQKDGDISAGLEKLHAPGAKHTVATMGVNGSYGFDGERFHHQPAYRVKALDTTGAGDVYHGAYVFGVLAGWDMPSCMRFASAAAAIKCTRTGGRAGAPTLNMLQKFMENEFPA